MLFVLFFKCICLSIWVGKFEGNGWARVLLSQIYLIVTVCGCIELSSIEQVKWACILDITIPVITICFLIPYRIPGAGNPVCFIANILFTYPMTSSCKQAKCLYQWTGYLNFVAWWYLNTCIVPSPFFLYDTVLVCYEIISTLYLLWTIRFSMYWTRL